MHSNNVANGLKVYTIRLVATPIVQAVTPSTPPRSIVVTGQLVTFNLNTSRTLTQIEYYDFLRRAQWKMFTTGDRAILVGNYLIIITEAM
jgi:hypothetical protein